MNSNYVFQNNHTDTNIQLCSHWSYFRNVLKTINKRVIQTIYTNEIKRNYIFVKKKHNLPSLVAWVHVLQ